MNINFDQVLTGLDKKPLKRDKLLDDGKREFVDMTLSWVCSQALLGADCKGVDGEEKASRFALAMKIYVKGCIDLEAEQIAKLKELIGKTFLPLIVGRAYEMLEKKNE